MQLISAENSMELARFMATPEGRGLRIAAGTAMIIVGISRGTWTGRLVATLGLVPLMAGALNICVLAPLLHVPVDGNDVR